jgi:predicted transcriptional regulator
MYAELENEISKRIKQLLIKQSNLTIKQVIKKINKDVGKIFYVDKPRIEIIIKSMINNKEIFITTKQSEDSFLNLVDRKSIYYCIDNNPGKTIEELCNLLDLTKSQMIWHLTFLKKIHYVYSKKKNRKTVYYSNNHHLQGAN